MFVAGVVGAATVGLADGMRVGLTAGLSGGSLVSCVALVTGLDVLLGAAVGSILGTLTSLTRWGRAVELTGRERRRGLMVLGMMSGAAVACVVLFTATRANRFLAAALAGAVALAAGALGLLLAPAAARLLRGSPARPSRSPEPVSTISGGTAGGAWLAAPAVALCLAAGVFAVVIRTRMAVAGAPPLMAALVAGAVAAWLPAIAYRASRVRLPLTRRTAVALAALLFGVPAVAAIWWRHSSDFRFLQAGQLGTAALIAAVAAGPAYHQLRKWGWRSMAPWALATTLAAVLGTFAAGREESARKAVVAAGGLAVPLLDNLRQLADRDGDGHATALGGDDCDDRDARVSPSARERPGDGIDQDCDGEDTAPALVTALPFHPVPDGVPAGLNILLVTIDSLRADRLGSYGYKRDLTPEMDRLASEGVVFDNAWANAPSTHPSLTVLHTGRWSSAVATHECTGCLHVWRRIGPEQPTLAETMKDAGWTTGGLHFLPVYASQYRRGFERGMDVYEAGTPGGPPFMPAPGLADASIEFVERNADRRWFLWAHFFDPHFDYQPHAEAPALGHGEVDRYDGEIWYVDHHLGRVLARLRQLGLWERTAVVITADHAESLGEQGTETHGYQLYRAQTKVPLLVRVPGLAPRRVPELVSHVDLAPTLLNLARGKPVSSFLGRSLVDLLANGAVAPGAPPLRPLLQEVTFRGPSSNWNGSRQRSLVTPTHHLIWNWMPANTTECYDLQRDPGELQDLWGNNGQQGTICASLKQELQTFLRRLSPPSSSGQGR